MTNVLTAESTDSSTVAGTMDTSTFQSPSGLAEVIWRPEALPGWDAQAIRGCPRMQINSGALRERGSSSEPYEIEADHPMVPPEFI
ncbi:MAG: hypothetical protein AAF211_04110 [Myxococcota bacterium]